MHILYGHTCMSSSHAILASDPQSHPHAQAHARTRWLTANFYGGTRPHPRRDKRELVAIPEALRGPCIGGCASVSNRSRSITAFSRRMSAACRCSNASSSAQTAADGLGGSATCRGSSACAARSAQSTPAPFSCALEPPCASRCRCSRAALASRLSNEEVGVGDNADVGDIVDDLAACG